MSRSSTKFTFKNRNGETLAGRLELPVGPPKAFALFAHCFTCSKNYMAAARISPALAAHGYAVLRFDFTGLGHSEGEFANTNFTSNVEDLVSAAEALREQFEAPRLLIGHSFGGAAVIAAAVRLDEVTAVATIGAPADPAHVIEHLGEKKSEIEKKGFAEVELAGRTFTIKKQLLDDVTSTSLSDTLAQLKKALLIYHAPLDNVVPIEHSRRLFEAAIHPKSFISLDESDHLVSNRADAQFVADTLAAWADRYAAKPSDEQEDDAPHGQVLVRETGPRYQHTILAHPHRLTADEPLSAGGGNTGPTPYDLLLSALGSCTSMTVRMYADRRKWPLDRVAVTLDQAKIHAEDCENCESKTGRVDRINLELDLEGDLDDDQRKRLFEIAGRCPVHRTLMGEKEINMTLRDPH